MIIPVNSFYFVGDNTFWLSVKYFENFDGIHDDAFMARMMVLIMVTMKVTLMATMMKYLWPNFGQGLRLQ